MNEFKRYAHAPIVEAILDIQVKMSDGTSLASLAKVGGMVEDAYPSRQDRVQFESEFTVGPDVGMAARQSQSQLGYIFISADERQSFQARLDGFTFSRLAPYTGWASFRDEARKLWDHYKSAVDVGTVTRLAVRYINRLDLPLPMGDLKDYLRTVPEVSPDLSQGLSGYFMQLQIPQEDIGGTLILNQAMLPPSSPNIVSVLLDIDLYRDANVSSDNEAMWELFEKLRASKNHIFESCITEKAKELIS
jgi:uncharacterized protein (TIGR04255 family)